MAKTGMPWFRVNAGWEDHPKVQDFCAEIRQPLGGMYVSRLWDYVARFYPDGSITASVATLERALRWAGKAGVLIDALKTHRLLDVTETGFAPHDWDEHNGAAYKKWLADKAKRKTPKGGGGTPPIATPETTAEPSANPTETRAGSDRNPPLTVRNGTVRNGTKNTQEGARDPAPPLVTTEGRSDPNSLEQRMLDADEYRDRFRALSGTPGSNWARGANPYHVAREKHSRADLLSFLEALWAGSEEKFRDGLTLDSTLSPGCLQKGLQLVAARKRKIEGPSHRSVNANIASQPGGDLREFYRD